MGLRVGSVCGPCDGQGHPRESEIETSAVEARLREVGAAIVAPERRTPAYLNSYVPEEIANWARIIKDSRVERK
jgi:hypothetical protein